VGVLLIHALLVLPFVLSLSLPSPRRPDTTGAGATAFASAAEPEMTVVFIDEPTPATSTSPSKPPPLASRGVAPPDVQLVVLSPDPSPAAANVQTADSTDAQEDTASSTEAAEHARLYGRYLGQVQARIERAWMRPRTEIGAPQFSCRTRIQQDRRGAVVEVTLDHCNGTERWQQSLVSAIRTASPLPAPPDVSVYADILWLSFVSEGFQSGGSAQGFEPEASQTGLVRDSDIARRSFEEYAGGARRMFKPHDKEDWKVIHLTIIGSPAPESSPSNQPPADPLPPPLPQSAAPETPPR
jgi:TonB C terminal